MTSSNLRRSAGERVRRAIIDTVVALLATVAVILVVEGAASAVLFLGQLGDTRAPAPLRRARTVPDTLLGWRNERGANRPDAYGKGIGLYTAENGFRRQTSSDTTVVAAGPGTIACSGDSYTLGYGVSGDQTWCALLERSLPGVHTINMGQESYGLDQTYLLYRGEGARTPHALQILAVTSAALERLASSDDAGWPKPELKVEQGALATAGVPVPPATPGEYRRAAIGRLLGDLRVVQAVRRRPSYDPLVERARAADAHRPVIEQLIAELQAAHRAAGTRLLLVYLPVQREITDQTLDERRAWLAGAAKRHAVDFVDLTPSLRAMGRDSSDVAYFARWAPVQPPGANGQLTTVGHAWVARMLTGRVAAIIQPSPNAARTASSN